MTIKANTGGKRTRIHWMDNLRTIIILLVVLYHVGGVKHFGREGIRSFHSVVGRSRRRRRFDGQASIHGS